MGAITNDWLGPLQKEFKKPYYASLYKFLRAEYAERTIYPPSGDVFNAFHLTPLSEVKVLILGQDPYHEPGQAHGLSFSVPKGQDIPPSGDIFNALHYTPYSSVKVVILGQDPYHNIHQAHGLCFSVGKEIPAKDIPPSLQNIYKELHDDLGCSIPEHGNLEKWAREGVLLLNAVLTVRAHQAASHRGKGWEEFTDAVISAVDLEDRPIAIILWGNFARGKKSLLTNPRHLVLEAPHPSPLSAHKGFFGSRPFSKTNDFLESHGVTPIDWQIV